MDVERLLRLEWWVNHGCSFHALYGDDGEMQCNADTCRKDFKREPLEDLQRHVEMRRMERVVAAYETVKGHL
jgi:hypothetical protein